MKDDHAVADTGQIDNPEGAAGLPYANLPHAGSNRLHRFPVAGVETLLDLAQLIARLRPRLIRKVSEVREAVAEEDDWFHGSIVSISILESKALTEPYLRRFAWVRDQGTIP